MIYVCMLVGGGAEGVSVYICASLIAKTYFCIYPALI